MTPVKPSAHVEARANVASARHSLGRLVRRFARALCKIEDVAEAEDYYISPAAGEMVSIASKALRPGKHLARKKCPPNRETSHAMSDQPNSGDGSSVGGRTELDRGTGRCAVAPGSGSVVPPTELETERAWARFNVERVEILSKRVASLENEIMWLRRGIVQASETELAAILNELRAEGQKHDDAFDYSRFMDLCGRIQMHLTALHCPNT